MTNGNNHITNLSKQYQHEDVCVCSTSEECLEEWGHFRQYSSGQKRSCFVGILFLLRAMEYQENILGMA